MDLDAFPDLVKRWTAGRVALVLGLAAVAAVFFWLYLQQLFIFQDVSMEEADYPFTVAHLELARAKGVNANDYFDKDPVWDNLKQEDPGKAYAYFGHQFHFKYFSCYAMGTLCYLPFVKLFGVGSHTVALYSTFYCLLAVIVLGIFAWLAFGRWHALLAIVFLSSSLSWLIHVKVGGTVWMPSVLVLGLMMLCAWFYAKRFQYRYLALMACMEAFLYYSAWLSFVFAGILIVLVVVLEGPRSFSRLLLSGLLVAGCFVAAILAIGAAYAYHYGLSLSYIQQTVLNGYAGRFSQGAVPFMHFTVAGRIYWGLWSLFVDMAWFEHFDKFLAGKPAISWVFTAFFVVGVAYAVKERSLRYRLLLIWMVAVFWCLATVSVFANRYALLVLPAMALLAACGLIGLGRDLARSAARGLLPVYLLVAAAALAATVVETHHNFYVEYFRNKEPNFDVDLVRGQSDLGNWLKKNCPADETLVVLNDPVTFPHTAFLFHTFGHPYRFAYWSNHFNPGSRPEEIKAWENRALSQYRRIVFAFTDKIIQNFHSPPNLVINNDWRPFLAAHPGLQPAMLYSFEKRRPSIIVFEITGSPAPPPAPPMGIRPGG